MFFKKQNKTLEYNFAPKATKKSSQQKMSLKRVAKRSLESNKKAKSGKHVGLYK